MSETASRSLRYGDELIRFHVRAQPDGKARRLAIHVSPEGDVTVDAPARATDAAVRAAVQRRAAWISRQVTASRERMAAAMPLAHAGGEAPPLLYLGRRYRLGITIDANGTGTARMRGGCIEVTIARRDPALIRSALDAWYGARAREVLARRLRTLAASTRGDATPPLRLQSMERQWGSCSPTGGLTLNPQLVKAPRECIDYVIIHELCHLKEHNHGPRFRRLLDARMPGWRAVKERLDGQAEQILRT